jgi:hypothetical protein
VQEQKAQAKERKELTQAQHKAQAETPGDVIVVGGSSALDPVNIGSRDNSENEYQSEARSETGLEQASSQASGLVFGKGRGKRARAPTV